MTSDQLSFNFGAPALQTVHYFAVRPSRDAASAVVALARGYRKNFGFAGHPYDAGRLHISLCEVRSRAGLRKGDLKTAQRAADAVKRAPFTVTLDRLCSFKGRATHPIVLCCDEGEAELIELRSALRCRLQQAGLWQDRKHFKPHVTLLWDRRRVPDLSLRAPIRWSVEDFVLVRSLFGRSRHVDLGRWPLRA